jgi:hypothetical protein
VTNTTGLDNRWIYLLFSTALVRAA